MAEEPTNVYESLDEVYGDDTEIARDRLTKIRDAFSQRFETAPEVYARSPGRVNLIGEHIDYEGYGVLPMAITLDTIVAVRRAGSTLAVCNVDAERYPEATFPVDPSQEVDVGKHNWANYFLGAYKGVFEHLAAHTSDGASVPAPTGLQVMIHGVVPTGGGLSSSAAIVCASALAVLAVHGITLTKGAVAEFTARAERYVGVTSGGMDQAISIMGRRGIAQHVEFNPVRGIDVALPSDATFVIANSLAVSNKAEGAEGRYNLRVVECRLAAAVLAVLLGRSKDEARGLKLLKEVEPLTADEPAGEHPTAAVASVARHLHENPYDTAEIEGLLGCKIECLFEGDASARRVLAKFSSFKLRQRALHVFAEKERVVRFAAVCADESKQAESKLAELAALMDASQASCRDLYECSCEELDALVAVAKGAGALASRLTGAGWGGCTVSLLKSADVESFISKVKESYYQPLIDAGRLKKEELDSVMFASRPASGGGVLKVKI